MILFILMHFFAKVVGMNECFVAEIPTILTESIVFPEIFLHIPVDFPVGEVRLDQFHFLISHIPEFPDNNIKKGVDAVGKHEELNS